MQTIKFNFDPLEELIKAGIRIEAKENTELDIFSTAKYRKIFICFIGSNNSNNINYKIEKNDKIVDLIEYENTLFVGLKGGNTFQLYKKKVPKNVQNFNLDYRKIRIYEYERIEKSIQ